MYQHSEHQVVFCHFRPVYFDNQSLGCNNMPQLQCLQLQVCCVAALGGLLVTFDVLCALGHFSSCCSVSFCCSAMGGSLAACLVRCISWSLVCIYHNGFSNCLSIVMLYILLVKKVECVGLFDIQFIRLILVPYEPYLAGDLGLVTLMVLIALCGG